MHRGDVFMQFRDLPGLIRKSETISRIGKIENVEGMLLEASGGRTSIGEIYMIYDERQNRHIPAEVIGFKQNKIQMMSYEDTNGISSGSIVRSTKKRLKIPVGDFLKGRVIDAMGRPIFGEMFSDSQFCYVENTYTNPLKRPPITERLDFGVKAIDGLLTIGKGQRIGIFAGSGVGKSTLLGMIAKNSTADINVIALVGERGREVREFIERDLGEEGRQRSVVVVATSDESSMMRMKCPLVATTIAEYFRNQGKDVLLMMDSLTRFAMAKREIGLSLGEPPVARGYTPSIYTEFPKLLERSGRFKEGSITGVYTVLVEGDDTNEPIVDTVRGILDGHIVLTRKLANENHFPAIDINASISRLMSSVASERQKELASGIRDILSTYSKNEDLISIGAYKMGTSQKVDQAISRIDRVNAFLMQGVNESFTHDEVVSEMEKILSD